MINQKIAMSALSIVTALALSGGATFAAFTSQATSAGNTFATGSLILTLNGSTPTASPVFGISDAVPGIESAAQKIDLANTGSVDAATTQISGLNLGGDGALQAMTTLKIYDDSNNSGIFEPGTDLEITHGHLSEAWAGTLLGFGLPHGGHHAVFATLTLDSGADNSVQGKSVSFDISFQANQ